MMEYLFFALGFAILLKGADMLVDGASSLAKKFKVSDMMIGLTVVAFGTSAPELVINITASLKGATDIAIGNILGSNIANILVIFGACALLAPLKVKVSTIKKDMPMHMLGIIALGLLANDAAIDGYSASVLSKSDGLVLLLFFSVYMYYVLRHAKDGYHEEKGAKEKGLAESVTASAAGLLLLAAGGEWVVTNAIEIAKNIGVSEILISLTIIAFGTSLPEIATSLVAVRKNNPSLAVGTAIGSNIFNVFFVLGVSAFIHPIAFSPSLNTDLLFLAISSTIVFAVAVEGEKKHTIEKKEGLLLLFSYAAYVAYILFRG